MAGFVSFRFFYFDRTQNFSFIRELKFWNFDNKYKKNESKKLEKLSNYLSTFQPFYIYYKTKKTHVKNN